jgi:hypothetical protein
MAHFVRQRQNIELSRPANATCSKARSYDLPFAASENLCLVKVLKIYIKSQLIVVANFLFEQIAYSNNRYQNKALFLFFLLNQSFKR